MRPPVRLLLLVMALGVLTACGSSSGPAGDPAAWALGPGQKLTARSTQFTAIVTRVGCSGGEQGRPTAPAVDVGTSSVVITFRMSPHLSGPASCQGTPGVPYHVRLGRPIGDRALVDSECHSGSTATSTAFCLRDGIRFRDGQVFAIP